MQLSWNSKKINIKHYLVLDRLVLVFILMIIGLSVSTYSFILAFIYLLLSLFWVLTTKTALTPTKELHILPENNPEPVIIFSEKGDIVYQNASSKRALPELEHLSDLVTCSYRKLIDSQYYTRVNHFVDKEIYAFNIKGQKKENRIIAFGFNITQLERTQQELNQTLLADSLTGIGNRKKLYEDIKSNNNHIILITLNIMHFGEFNSFYGNKTGDKLLRAYAELLETNLKQINDQSQAYRLNGNTFALLISFSEANSAYLANFDLILKEMHYALSQHQFNIDNIQINFNVRFGVNTDKRQSDDKSSYAESLIINSETALQEAKNRNVPILFYKDIPNIKETYQINLKWSKRLRDILIHKKDGAKIVSYFQPIYDLKAGKIKKYEALVRIKDKETLHAPFQFLKAAEQLHLLSKLTRFVLVDFLKAIKDTDYSGSINLSNQDLEDEKLMEFFQDQCQFYQVDPSRITLEILEDELMYESIPTIKKWKEQGYKIAIDDFGVGYSNFKKLQLIEADYIKIDGSLIKNLVNTEQDVKIVCSIASYAKAINAEVIAEFVSSEAIFEKLKKMNIDYAQGFFIGQPNETLEILKD